MKLDETTGLPELPEGDWWEVRRRKVQQFSQLTYGYYTVEEGYEVAWMTPNKSGKKLVRERKHWFSFKKSFFYVDSNEPHTFAKEPIKKYDTISGESIPENITQPMIKAAAYTLVTRIADEALTKSLLGSYPPKKLT